MLQAVNELINNLTTEPKLNLELALNTLAAEVRACECFVVIEEDKSFKIIASLNEGIAKILEQDVLEEVKTKKRGIVKSNVMCIPVTVTREDDSYQNDKRKDIESYMIIKGYVYFQSLNPANHFTQEFIDGFSQINGLLANCIESYQILMVASTDKLTGALNRKYMDMALETCLEHAKNTNSSFSVVMTDLDYFKHVNDTYGHLVGDDVLRDTSDIIRKTIRKGDTLGRYGGEEFVVMLNDTSAEEAREMAEKLRLTIYEAKILGDKRDITTSLGVATYPDHADTVKNLVDKADKALYIAKKTGRNKHEIWDDSMNDLVIVKDSKQEFFSGDNAKDAARTQSLFKLMSLARLDIPVTEKLNDALREIQNLSSATDITLFMTGIEGKITDSFRLTSPGCGTPDYNDDIINDVITKRNSVYLVDWDNIKNNVSAGFTDWQSIAVAPAYSGGIMKGVLYAGVSIKTKEFKADEMAFIQNAAYIVASMIQ